MAKGGGQQTVTQSVDPQTQAYVNQMRQLALGYAGVGASQPSWATGPTPAGGSLFANASGRLQQGTPYQPIVQALPPGIQQAQQQYGNYAQAGQTGLAALTGGPNPFMNQYLSQMNPTFDYLRQNAVNMANDQATQQGAFGGDRSALFSGAALGDVNRQQALLNYQAFNDAQQRALEAAQLGYGATGLAAFLPQQYASGQLGILQQALGPYGQTQSQPLYQNRGAGIIGGAVAGAPLGPLGILGGGLLGSGLFG